MADGRIISTTQDYPDHIVTDNDGEWHNTRREMPRVRSDYKCDTIYMEGLEGRVKKAHKQLIQNGYGGEAKTSVSKAEAKSPEFAIGPNKMILKAFAGARAGHGSASASASPVGAKASAKANLFEADANAGSPIVNEIAPCGFNANARAVYGEAAAHAGVGIDTLGAYAGVGVSTFTLEAGISNTPLQAHLKGPGADAEAGVSWQYAGASAGAYFAEARAGPFAIREGVKFGVGMRYGVPEVDAGPVTVPCSIQ